MGKYQTLLRRPGFQPFLWTQFLGAFNDNIYKIVVSMLAVRVATTSGSGYLPLVGAIFILPFLFFSGYAGHIADAVNKRKVLIGMKLFEVFSMLVATAAFWSGRIEWMLCGLFLAALQATFFSPAKYGIVPEMLPDKDLSRANGLLEMSTFLAIILGTSIGSILFSAWKENLIWLGLVLVGIAVAGVFTSFQIGRVADPDLKKPLQINPWGEVGEGIRRLYQDQNLWLTVIGISYFWFLGALLQMDLLLLGKEVMQLDDFWTGILGTFLAIGIGIGSLAAGRLSGDKVELGLVPLGSIGMGVSSILLSQAGRSYVAAAAALVGLGFSGGLFVVPLNAFLQQKGGAEEKGRLIATNNFLNTIGVLLASGALWLLSDWLLLPVDRIILLFGLFTLAATVYLLKILPDFLIRFTLWMLTHTIYRIRIKGQEHVPFKGPALLVCNHVSFADGLLVGACVQRFIRFLVYKDFFGMKPIGWLLRTMRAIPIAGGNRKEVIESIERAREELRRGHVVCIFAEGAISRTGNMLPFKKGFEKIIKDLDVPIIPVHLDRLWGSIFSYEKGRFFWKWPRRIPYPVTVSFGAPLPATASAQEVRQAVMMLGSDAVETKREKGALLHLKFISSAKAAWRQFCMADSIGKELTYGQALIGSLLLSRRIRRRCADQKRVGVMLPSSVGGALANIAVLMAGKVPVNLNFTAGREAIDSAIDQCEIKTILTSAAFITKAKIERRPEMVYLEEISKTISTVEKISMALIAFLLPSWALRKRFCPEKGESNQLATVIFSSGSTGEPKGVMLSHHNILSNIESFSQVFWVTEKDRVMGVLPFFHSFGFTVTLWFPLIARFGAVYHPNPMDAKVIGEVVAKYQATILISTPTFYSGYIRRCTREEFSSLRYAIVGAEKLRTEIAEAFRERYGLDLLEGYGCTELSPVVSVNVPDVTHGREYQKGSAAGTVGHPIPGVTVKVVDLNTGKSLPVGEEGLLLVKGPNVMLGYLHQPEKTATVIRDEWYITGDIACIDEEGFIRITDRLSRFSKIGGEMVPHIKIEERINAILQNGSGAVTAIPDEQKGERLVIFYADHSICPETLWSQMNESGLPKLWIPKRENIYSIDALPVLGTGKLDLRELKKMASERTTCQPRIGQ